MSSAALTAYQNAFAELLGAGAAFGYWRGRVALYAILKAMGIGRGDEVIVPGYTCVMAVNPILYLGATAVFVDIDPLTYNAQPDQVAAAVTPRTRAIIAQHTYGYPAPLDVILEIGRRHGVPVIEDCCLALGSTWRGQLVGTLGHAAYFSFQWNKPYTSGLGGMAVTSDERLAERLRQLSAHELRPPAGRRVGLLAAQLAAYRVLIYPRTTALAQTLFRWLVSKGVLVGSASAAEMRPQMESDFFTGMSGVQARAGHRQLGRLQGNLEHRRRMGRLYDTLLAERGWPVTPATPGSEPVLVRYPVRVADKQKALATAAGRFVELGSWFECPLHPKETRMAEYGYTSGMCPEAERASREVVNLPLHPRADEATARRSVSFVASIGRAGS